MNKTILILAILAALIVSGCTGQPAQDGTDNSILFEKALDMGLQYLDHGYNYSVWGAYKYEVAGINYTYREWSGVVSNCQAARDFYLNATREISLSLSFFQEARRYSPDGPQLEILDNLILLSSTDINLSYVGFEICEHFENVAIAYSQDDYDSGNFSIQEMNVKILERDDIVIKHNSYLSKIRVLSQLHDIILVSELIRLSS